MCVRTHDPLCPTTTQIHPVQGRLAVIQRGVGQVHTKPVAVDVLGLPQVFPNKNRHLPLDGHCNPRVHSLCRRETPPYRNVAQLDFHRAVSVQFVADGFDNFRLAMKRRGQQQLCGERGGRLPRDFPFTSL